jgi:hypothetical protein
MVKGEKWVVGGKELWHLFFLNKCPVKVMKRMGVT